MSITSKSMHTTALVTGTLLLVVLGGCGPRGPRQAIASESGTTAAGSAQTSARLVADTNAADGGMMGARGMGGAGMMGRGMMGGSADTAAAPTASADTTKAPACPDISKALVDEGHKVFTGAGSCFACHGSDAHGTPLAPNLTDDTWLDIDGSYAAIAALVRSGVPHPKQHPAPMPPMGGAHLTSKQVCAVAAYVHGLGGGKD